MESKQALLKAIKYTVYITLGALIIGFILLIIIGSFYPCESCSSEPIENPIIVEGVITDKYSIHDGMCDDYYFTLNGTVEIKIGICTYDFFDKGDYCYIRRMGELSKDGVTWVTIYCDDFSRLWCIRAPLLTHMIIIGFSLVIFCMCVLLIIRFGIPFLRMKLEKKKQRKKEHEI